MWTEKDSWHAFAIKALIFLDFPWMRLRISKGKKQCYAFCGVWVLWWLSFVFKAPVPYNFREAGFNTMFWRLTWKACQIMLWMVKLTYRRMHDCVQSIFANWFMSCGTKIPNLTFMESFVNVSTRMLLGTSQGTYLMWQRGPSNAIGIGFSRSHRPHSCKTEQVHNQTMKQCAK